MTDEIEFAGAADLTPLKTEHPRMGLKFRNEETGHEFLAEVFDKYPQLGDIELDGRHYVEVSVQLWVDIMAQQGYRTVDPNESKEND